MSHQVNEAPALKPLESDTHLKSNASEIDKMVADAAASFDESVRLSSTSKQLEAIKKSLQDIPEINEARVLYFKAEIELNNYIIDSEHIALKMLNNPELI